MKFPERWHTWPGETPPEGVPLRIEVWNDYYEAFECAVGIFWKGEFFQHEHENRYGEYTQRLFNHVLEQVFWRLWEDEEDEE